MYKICVRDFFPIDITTRNSRETHQINSKIRKLPVANVFIRAKNPPPPLSTYPIVADNRSSKRLSHHTQSRVVSARQKLDKYFGCSFTRRDGHGIFHEESDDMRHERLYTAAQSCANDSRA